MKEETLKGLRAIKEAIKHAGGIIKISVFVYDQSS